MSLKVDRVQLEIVIKNDASRAEIRKLEDQVRNLNREMKKIPEGTEEWNKKFNDLKSAQNRIDDLYDKIGLTGLSVKELTKKQRELNAMMKNLDPRTKEWKDLNEKLKQVKGRMAELKTGAEQVKDGMAELRKGADQAKSGIFGLTGNFKGLLGSIGLVAGGIALFKKGIDVAKQAINSIQTTSDKFAATMGGLKEGYDSFLRSIATGDISFKGLIQNFRDAFAAGKEYVQILDDLEDRQRSLKVAEAEAKKYQAEQLIIARTTSLSETERLKAIDNYINKESELVDKRIKNAQRAYNAELLIAKERSHLTQSEIEDFLRNYDDITDKMIAPEELGKITKELNRKSVAALAEMNKIRDKALNENRRVTEEEQQQMNDIYNQQYYFANQTIIARQQELQDYIRSNEYKTYKAIIENAEQLSDPMRDRLIDAWTKVFELNAQLEDENTRILAMRENLIAEIMKQDGDLSKDEADLQQKLFELRQKYGLVGQSELWKREMEDFLKNNASKLLSEEEYSKAIKAIREKYFNELPSDSNMQSGVTSEDFAPEMKRALADAEYERQLYMETDAYKRELLAKQLADGKIGEKQYADEIKALDDAIALHKLENAEKVADAAMTFTDAISNFIEARKNKELKAAGDDENKKEAIEKKFAEKQRNIAAGQAAISGALAVMKIAADVPKFDFGIMTGILIAAQVAMTASEIALIESQQFYKGGYTGNGRKHERAGTVHKGEYVINQEGLSDPVISRFVAGYIEPRRLQNMHFAGLADTMNFNRGFASGGYTSQPVTNNINIDNSELKAELAANRQMMAMMVQYLKTPPVAIVPDSTSRKIRDRINEANAIENYE